MPDQNSQSLSNPNCVAGLGLAISHLGRKKILRFGLSNHSWTTTHLRVQTQAKQVWSDHRWRLQNVVFEVEEWCCWWPYFWIKREMGKQNGKWVFKITFCRRVNPSLFSLKCAEIQRFLCISIFRELSFIIVLLYGFLAQIDVWFCFLITITLFYISNYMAS